MNELGRIHTPTHDIVVQAKGDNEYPGIWVNAENDAPIVTVEYSPNRIQDGTPGIQVMVWDDVTSEEPAYYINVENINRY